jgi:hypothetical protein
MKLLNIMVLLLIIGGLVLSSTPSSAETPLDEAIIYNGEVAEPMVDGIEEVISETEDVTVSTTGNRWVTDDGVILWEYKAKIMATNEEDTSWHQQSTMTYATGQSGFTAMITGTTALVRANCEDVCGEIIWTPKILIGGITYPVIGNPIIINDMYDNAYVNNVIKWDYGVCTRYLRVLDGTISEQFVFDVKPTGDISIDMGIDPSSTLGADIIYAVDASYNPIAITLADGIKTVTLDAMMRATFPITIDPSFTQFKTSNFDGNLCLSSTKTDAYGAPGGQAGTENFSVLWDNASATTISTALLTGWNYYTDQWTCSYYCYYNPAYCCNESHFSLYRSYLHFNTSLLLWGANISSATLGLYATAVYNDNSSYHPPLGKVMVFRGIHNVSDELALPPLYPTAPINATWVPPFYWTPGHWNFPDKTLLSDFNQSKYVDTPIGISATNVTVNGTYYTMPLTAEGIRSINTNDVIQGVGENVSYSSFLVRIEREVDAIADWNGSDKPHYFGGKQYVAWGAFEDGVSQRPYLEVTYVFYAPPLVRTDTASQIGMEVARVNGYLEYDGASPCKVGLLVKLNSSVNYSVASGYYGDLDGDGWVTGADYTLLDAYLYTSGPLSPDQILRSDLNDDSIVDANDSAEMVLVRAGGYNNDRIYHSAGVTTGELFGKMITGLTAGATYNVTTVAWHNVFSASGTVRQFTTIAVLGDVSNFNADSECDTVSLTWTKANGSTSTMVRWKKYSAPTTIADGTLLVDTTAAYYQHTGLESGVGYYYSAWGVITGNYSATPAEVTITTTACGGGDGGGGGTGTGGDVITVPNSSSWFNPPSSEGVKKIPGYAFINQMADAIGMPHGTWWFLLSMGFSIVVSMWVFYRSEQILLAFITMCGLNVLFAMIGTAPWWILLIFSISSLGFSWKELR